MSDFLSPPSIQHFIGGQSLAGGSRSIPVISPLDGSPLGEVLLADAPVVDEAVEVARKAGESWGSLPVKERVQPLFRFKTIVESRLGQLAEVISRENGKTPAEAAAGVLRGL